MHTAEHLLQPRGSYAIKDPADIDVRIPAHIMEDYQYVTFEQSKDIYEYYTENGYVVVRDLIPKELCDKALTMFAREVKPFSGFMYRQATGNPERHVFTECGLMLNSILNIQSLNTSRFGGFQAAGLAIITNPRVQSVCELILGEPGILVQSMFFEGNPVTWPHQDTYYLDAERIGGMTAVWIAAVDIAPGAGRFFVYPKSHQIDMERNAGEFGIAFHHDRYKQRVIDVIRSRNLQCRAPAMQKGDALFWSSKTIHGSLQTTEPRFPRSSFSAHYIPESSRFLQFQARIRRLRVAPVNGMAVHRPKDLNRMSNRAAMWVEAMFPRIFRITKKGAIKLLTG